MMEIKDTSKVSGHYYSLIYIIIIIIIMQIHKQQLQAFLNL